MSKHLADHREASTGGRLRNFIRLAHQQSQNVWVRVWQRPFDRSDANRRTLEFIRIERQRDN